MKAITLTQPWASLIVEKEHAGATDRYAIKSIESRSWYLRPESLPMRVAVHAAKGIDPLLRANITKILPGKRARIFTGPYAQGLLRAGLPPTDPWAHPTAPTVPLGAIIGCVTVVRIVPADVVTAMWKRGELSDLVYELGNFAAGRFGWVLRDPISFATPIACSGRQGLWTVPPPIACEIVNADPHARAA